MKLLPLLALLLGVCAHSAIAERTPPRALPLGEAAEPRVIVKFKPAAAAVRAHALSASDQRATASALEQRASALGARHGVRLRAGAALGERVQVMHGEPGSDGRALAARLAQDADVEYAEVDRRARRTAVPNDPRFATVSGNGPAVGQWYLKAPAGDVASSIDAVSAWDTTMGSASIIVAVLDTGVRPNHPDLAGKLIGGYDFVTDVAISNDGDGRDGDPSDPGDFVTRADLDRADGLFDGCGIPGSGAGGEDPAPSSWHGTQVSGIIGAATNNGTGMAGAGWDVRVMPVRVLGKCFGNTSDINAAIRWAAGVHIPGVPNNPNPARVINLSLGSRDSCSPDDIDAIAAANAAGSVVVVAAGNTAGLAANSPANCPGAIGVAAVRHVGTKVGFSDVGPELSIAAPGGNCVNLTGACLYPILTTIDSGTTAPRLSTYTDSFNASVGTSFSSPLVAATAALMLSVQPALTPDGVRAGLQASARPFPSSGVVGDPNPVVACQAPTTTEQLECYCTTSTCGAGMLDTGAAVRAVTGIRVVIDVSPAAPVAGQAVMLSGDASTVALGRSIAGWQWSLADPGTTGSTLVDATAATATLQPAAAGTVTVRLVVTDDRGVAVALQQGVVVAAAPVPPAASGGGGGGVMSWLWLLALSLATVILAYSRWGSTLTDAANFAKVRGEFSAMNLQSVLRASVCCAAALLLSGPSVAQALGSARATSTVAARTVNGLIVQMRDAPSHVEVARERARARAAGATADASAVGRDSLRWQRLVADVQGDAVLRRELPQLAGTSRRDPVGARAQLLRFDQPLTPPQAELLAARIAARADVEWVAPNVRERRQAIATSPPTDPLYASLAGQWWLQPVQGSDQNAIDARLRGVPGYLSAWTAGTGTTGLPSAVVAVLDTGTTPHPELAGHMLPGFDFVSDSGYANDGDGRDADPSDPGDWVSAVDRSADDARFGSCDVEDSSWHGTVIAGMLAAKTNSDAGGAAMNWNGRVLPVRVAGKCGADLADIIEGMRWAAGLPACKTSDGNGGCAVFAPPNANPARIINISFGGSAACGAAYQQAIDDVRAAPGGGAVVVAAAGNDWGAPSRPASCQRVVGVGALNRDGFKTNYSNFGATLTVSTVGGDDNDGAWGPWLADSGLLTVGNTGLTAPGTNDYFFHFGTSFSAPVVSGAASLMLSINPDLTVHQIIAGLKASARPHVRSSVAGVGPCSESNPGRCVCTSSTCGAGMLDVQQALLYAHSPTSYMPPNWPLVSLDTPELRAAVAVGPDRPANTSPPPPPSNSSAGGGAMSAAWLLALLAAAWALRTPLSASLVRTARSPRRRPRD